MVWEMTVYSVQYIVFTGLHDPKRLHVLTLVWRIPGWSTSKMPITNLNITHCSSLPNNVEMDNYILSNTKCTIYYGCITCFYLRWPHKFKEIELASDTSLIYCKFLTQRSEMQCIRYTIERKYLSQGTINIEYDGDTNMVGIRHKRARCDTIYPRYYTRITINMCD